MKALSQVLFLCSQVLHLCNANKLVARTASGSIPTKTLASSQQTTDPAFIGYTSAFGSYSPISCNAGSTFKSFSNTLGSCCTTQGNCNPVTECFAGKIAFLENGDASTCSGDCSTGFLFQTLNDNSPLNLPGCNDIFSLYRDIDAAASQSLDGTNTDSPSAASSSASNDSHSSSGIKRPAIVAIVIVGLLFILLIAGLVAYIFILRKKNSKNIENKNGGRPTELNKINTTSSDSMPENFGKSELPVDGSLAWELPSTPASGHPTPIKYNQPPNGQQHWSPHTPAEAYPHTFTGQFGQPPTQPYSALELPAGNRRSTGWGGTSELPG